MRPIAAIALTLSCLLVFGGAVGARDVPAVHATAGAAREQPKEPPQETVSRLHAILTLRARSLMTGEPPGSGDYLPGSRVAQWALNHEKAKLEYLRRWAETRGIRLVDAEPSIKLSVISQNEKKVRFYVAQSLALGYTYPGEEQVNRFGVGSRHIIDLYRTGDQWAIGLEWYADPLGDEHEVPALSDPGGERESEDAALSTSLVRRRGYSREGAVRYADQYCGLAAGCGNENRYNSRYRDFSGEGGNCANFASQVLRAGGGLHISPAIRSDHLIHNLLSSGRGRVAFRGRFADSWRKGLQKGRFPEVLQKGDLVFYQLKGRMEHVAVVTALDSRGYPMVNSHTADRYHVPFDLGWDRSTIFWMVRIRD